MKTRRIFEKISVMSLIPAIALTSILFIHSMASGQTKPIIMNFNSVFAPESNQAKFVYAAWMNEIEKRTGGRVKIVPHWLSSLTPYNQAYTGAITGIVDIAEIDLQLYTGLVPMYDMVHYSPPSTPYVRYCKIISQLEKEFPDMKKGWRDVHHLFVWCMGNTHFLGNKAIRKVEDAKGVKLGSVGGEVPNVTRGMGFSPITVMPADVYTSLDKGVIDGLAFVADMMIGFRVADVIKYHTYVSTGSATFGLVMNQKKWDSLPSDIKQAFDEVNKWAIDFFDQSFHDLEKKAIAYSEKKGVETIYLSPEEYAKWDQQMKPVQEEFVKKLESKGFPGRKAFERYLELLSKNKM